MIRHYSNFFSKINFGLSEFFFCVTIKHRNLMNESSFHENKTNAKDISNRSLNKNNQKENLKISSNRREKDEKRREKKIMKQSKKSL